MFKCNHNISDVSPLPKNDHDIKRFLLQYYTSVYPWTFSISQFFKQMMALILIGAESKLCTPL